MSAETTPDWTQQGPEQRSFSLRERKRTRTRLMVQSEALKLFDQKGYTDTTIEEIADAAAISPRTFFRYFPTKEDVVFWDEYDPIAAELLDSRPVDEPLAEAFRGIVRETLAGLYRRDPDRLLVRIRLASSLPELRARFLDEQAQGIEEFIPLLARKRGSDLSELDELQVRVVASALIAAVSVALDLWQRDDGTSDLIELLDRSTEALADAIAEMKPAGGGSERRGRRRSRG